MIPDFDNNLWVDLLYQQIKADRFAFAVDQKYYFDKEIIDSAFKNQVNILDMMLDLMGFPPEIIDPQEAEDSIARDWLTEQYIDILMTQYPNDDELKIDLYEYIQYLKKIIADHKNGIDIEPYFQEVWLMHLLKAKYDKIIQRNGKLNLD